MPSWGQEISQGRPGRASQAARLTSSATASSRRWGHQGDRDRRGNPSSQAWRPLFQLLVGLGTGWGSGLDSVQGMAGVEWAGALHLDTRHPQGREPPSPNKTGAAIAVPSTPPSHQRGGGCPPGKGRGPQVTWPQSSPDRPSPHPAPGGTKGSPALLTSPMINYPPPKEYVREGAVPPSSHPRHY